jgi:hypothetical protein
MIYDEKDQMEKDRNLWSSLLDKLCSLLPEGLSTKYSTAKLQTRLQNHYGDTIVIESQKGQGQSNIVFSSKRFLVLKKVIVQNV